MARTYFLPTIFLTIGIVAPGLFAENPIITHKYTADPSAMVYNGRVYVYCSHDDNNLLRPDGSVDYRIVAYTLISSDDMSNWTDHGEVFHARRNTSWAKLAFAPSCIEKNGKCYLYFPDGGDQIGVVVADQPEGPFIDPLGRPLIDRSMPNCDVEWCFDPCAFIDDDGQAYLYFGGGMKTVGRNLRVIRLGSDMISTIGGAECISAPKSFEASFMHKYKGNYYFSYATDGASRIDYLTGRNPIRGFNYKGTVLDNPSLNGRNINCSNNNHASIVNFHDKWYMFYHDRRLSGTAQFRNVCVDLLTYAADGSINPVVITEKGPPQIKFLDPFDTVQAETIGKQKGITTAVCSEGGMMVTNITSGDWICYSSVDFGRGAMKFSARVAAASGGTIELHVDSVSGAKVGMCTVTPTGGSNSWKTLSCTVSNTNNVRDLYLVFRGTGEPFRINWFRFSPSVGGK